MLRPLTGSLRTLSFKFHLTSNRYITNHRKTLTHIYT